MTEKFTHLRPRDKGPSKFAIAREWVGVFVEDIREHPACFACGKETRSQLWNQSNLDRAHVIAHTAGGSDGDPRNYVLLCRSCHEEAPMTNKPEIMLDWVRGRENYLTRLALEIKEIMSELGVEEDDLARLGSVTLKDLRAEADEIAADHHPSNRRMGLILATAVKSLVLKKDEEGDGMEAPVHCEPAG